MLRTLAIVFALMITSRLDAQPTDSLALVRRATEISAMLNGAPVRHDTIFSESFLAQVPAARLGAIVGQLATSGRIENVVMTAMPAPGGPPGTSAVFQLSTAKGVVIPMTLVIADAAPNLVSGLLFGAPAHTSGTLDDALRELRALPGHASLFVARVEGSKLIPIVAEDTGRALAIGSAFKLYVLAALVRDVESGRRRWSDVVPIDSLSKSLPSGFLHTWPAGTPVTLQTLATLMISISDNTAADHLLRILGRENVEAMQAVSGHAQPALNEPFLSTREMFVLKSPDHTTLLDRYLHGSTVERRAILRDSAVTSRQRRGPDFSSGPIAIEGVEWFATTADLARAMVWIRDHSASGAAAAARGVLSVNKGIDWPQASWKYAAFKGGSEPGVLNLTFMAQRADGQWMVFVATWNNQDKAVDEPAFVALVARIRDLTGVR